MGSGGGSEIVSLDAREIHVWVARTDADVRELARILSDDERDRAARFRFEDDQRRSIVARATLRTLLARYLDRDPHQLHFTLGPQGKPALATSEIEFNVSHSGEYVLLAFARESPVGVDVETEKRTSDMLAISERYFSPAEAEEVRNASNIAAAFYKTWTAKESVIKAAGGGLSIDLTSFRVTPSSTFTRVESDLLAEWSVQMLPSPGDGYHAAVAARGSDWTTIVRVH
ncbi:MAG TPA: 4'-phosphopantetheinyl transferase superfamily protein [Thermoanaerobaculia bacterium]|nr:4'-phosphopantetheinyl transferase superfamily protein [Thermoanaerobaculia bacterium]